MVLESSSVRFFQRICEYRKKNIRKERRREKRWSGKVWHSIKKKRSTMQQDSLISFYAFYLLVLASIGDVHTDTCTSIEFLVLCFLTFQPVGLKESSSVLHFFLSISLSFFIPLHVYSSISFWKNGKISVVVEVR